MNLKLQTQAGTEYPLTAPSLTVGREHCEIMLPEDTLVSRTHARFQVQGETVTVTDLGSTNGTHINQVLLHPHVPQAIRVGDAIRIGSTVFVLRMEGGAGPTRAIGDGAEPTRAIGGVQPWQAQAVSWSNPVPPAGPAWIPPTTVASSAPGQTPIPAFGYPTKSKSTAMLLEIGIGLFALLGFGWIYAGQSSTGIVLLIVNIMLNIGYWIVAAVTVGVSLICTVPLQIAAVEISAVMLNSHMNKNPDRFR